MFIIWKSYFKIVLIAQFSETIPVFSFQNLAAVRHCLATINSHEATQHVYAISIISTKKSYLRVIFISTVIFTRHIFRSTCVARSTNLAYQYKF